MSSKIENMTQTKEDNLTKKERIALIRLQDNENIIINKADKGSTIIVQDKVDYIREGLTHLNNPTVYRNKRHIKRNQSPDLCISTQNKSYKTNACKHV